MISAIQRYRESLERANQAKLQEIIKRLTGKEKFRVVSKVQRTQRGESLLREIGDTQAAQVRLERVLGGNDLTDISYLATGTASARSVCRVVIREGGQVTGFGSGFLVAPGVVLTNHHVLPSIDEVRYSTIQFRYERDLRGNELEPVEYALRVAPEPIIFKGLDMALVAVEPQSVSGEPLNQFGWLKLNPQSRKAFVGEYLTIIQHPGGERKQVCVRENKLLEYSDAGPYLWYQTDTAGGSSGSPVFNNSWDVVALHHSSVPKTKKVRGKDMFLARNGKIWNSSMGEDEIDWIANEGVRISRIMEYLVDHMGTHPLAVAVRDTAKLPLIESQTDMGEFNGIKVLAQRNGRTRIFVPIDIGIPAYPGEPNFVVPAQETPVASVGGDTGSRLIEKVVIKDNYTKRNGYDPAFLGKETRVPLPKVIGTKYGKQVVKGRSAELRYWNYSVVMNATRRLAFFSAANVDVSRFRGKRDADGDTWYYDTRIDKSVQMGTDFYKKQKQFEANRTASPFDQGHLTRRSDLQWGNTDKEAKRNGDDSYHYTNCSPQHWQFNQNSKTSGLWFRLEESAINSLSSGTKLIVINGPVFDAPVCKPGLDGELRLNLKGARKADPAFGGYKIPKQFFKVIAYRSGSELRGRAFVVTQEDLLKGIDRLESSTPEASRLTDREIRLYQVRIADLGKLTGLDFGSLAKSDVSVEKESFALTEGLPITDLSQIRF